MLRIGESSSTTSTCRRPADTRAGARGAGKKDGDEVGMAMGKVARQLHVACQIRGAAGLIQLAHASGLRWPRHTAGADRNPHDPDRSVVVRSRVSRPVVPLPGTGPGAV